jgi:outer membrane protein assembly factor BamB
MRAAVAGLVSLLAAPSLPAADWPQWRGPARDGRAPDFVSRAVWPESLKPAWTARVGEGHSSPVVAAGRVFQLSREGEEEVVRALELATGRQLWRQAYPAPYTMSPAARGHGKGPKSTPVVAGGRVFTFGIGGVLSAFDASSGRPLWRREFGSRFRTTSPEFGVATSPAVEGETLLVHVGGKGDGALLALDVATGEERWAWTGDGPGYASPVVATLAGVRQVITQTQGRLVGVSADAGRLLWSLPFATDYEQNAVTPLVHGDLVIYAGINHPVRAVRVAPAGGGLAAAPAWENAEAASYMSTPVLAQGRLYGLSHRRRGQLYCLDAASGRTLWLGEGRLGDNAALVAAGDVVLVLTTGAELLVVAAEAAGPRVPRRWTLATSPTWAHPAVLPDALLVKDADTLALLRFE